VRHLVKHLQVSVGYNRRAEVVVFIFKHVNVVENLWLPVHEFLNFKQFGRRYLHEQSASKVEGALVLKHLW